VKQNLRKGDSFDNYLWMESYWIKRIAKIEPEPYPDKTPPNHWNYCGFVKSGESAINLKGFSFQFLSFVFRFVENLEDPEDTQI
jgi:hypothetical protein